MSLCVRLAVSAEGHIKLADFGLSAEGPGPQPLSADGAAPNPALQPMYMSAVGTTDYLAPEILVNEGE